MFCVCVWVVNTQYSIILYTPPPPLQGFSFCGTIFSFVILFGHSLRVCLWRTFFWRGCQTQFTFNSFHDAVWWCSLDCEVQHTYGSQQRHRHTYRQSHSLMSLFLKWQLWQFCSCCHGGIFGSATLLEKEKEADFISPVEGNYIYWHPEHTLTSVERGVCCICTVLWVFTGPIYGFRFLVDMYIEK